jgi:ribosomal protein S27E
MEESRLDGNAMAGLLSEIFPFEMTTARTRCAGCGAMEAVGRQTVYADAPGTVMRCLHCESVLIRIVHGGGRYWLDMRGVACLEVEELQ